MSSTAITKTQALAVSLVDENGYREEIAGVLLGVGHKAVATDSYILVEITNTDVVEDGGRQAEDMIIKADVVKAIGKSLEKGKVAMHTNVDAAGVAHFIGEGATWSTKPIEGSYPKYELALPEGSPVASIVLDAKYLVKMAKLCVDAAKQDGTALSHVTLEVYGQNAPVMVKMHTPKHAIRGVIMPVRQ